MAHIEIEPILRGLFASERYAVVGTQGVARVSLNLMAVAVTEDLRSLILATKRATTKYRNLRDDPRVSLLVDNRTNQSVDTKTALALTIDGMAEEVTGEERTKLAEHFVARHHQLALFVHSSSCALFRVRVERYELVRGLYEVREVLIV